MSLARRYILVTACATIMLAGACLAPGTECLSDAECSGEGSYCNRTYRVCAVCTDTVSDQDNCGFCGNVCPADPHGAAACHSGTCGLDCEAGYSTCGTDRCQVATTNESCGGGCVSCNIPPASGLNITNAGCCQTAEATDNSCDSFCTAGTGNCSCRFECASGFADCDLDTVASADTNGCEVQLSVGKPDEDGGYQHCGACNNDCPRFPNTTPSCDGADGGCTWSCSSSNWGNCDGDISTGCESELNTNTNCGRCGESCPPPGVANVAANCSTGTCTWSCSPNWEDCDGNRNNGCEINLSTDRNHCGTCAVTTCDSCLNGACGTSCPGAGMCYPPTRCGTCRGVDFQIYPCCL